MNIPTPFNTVPGIVRGSLGAIGLTALVAAGSIYFLAGCGADNEHWSTETGPDWANGGMSGSGKGNAQLRQSWTEGNDINAHFNEAWYPEFWMDATAIDPGSNCASDKKKGKLTDDLKALREFFDETDWTILYSVISYGDYAAAKDASSDLVIGQGPGVMTGIIRSNCMYGNPAIETSAGDAFGLIACWDGGVEGVTSVDDYVRLHIDLEEAMVDGKGDVYHRQWDLNGGNGAHIMPATVDVDLFSSFWFEITETGSVSGWGTMDSGGDYCAEVYSETYSTVQGTVTTSASANVKVDASGNVSSTGGSVGAGAGGTFGATKTTSSSGSHTKKVEAEHFIELRMGTEMTSANSMSTPPTDGSSGDGGDYYGLESSAASASAKSVTDSSGGLGCVPAIDEYVLMPVEALGEYRYRAILLGKPGSSPYNAAESALKGFRILEAGAVDKIEFEAPGFAWGMFPEFMDSVNLRDLGIEYDVVSLSLGTWVIESYDPLEPATVQVEWTCMEQTEEEEANKVDWGDAYRTSISFAPWDVEAELRLWKVRASDYLEETNIKSFIHVMVPGSSEIMVLPVTRTDDGRDYFRGGFMDFMFEGYVESRRGEIRITELDVSLKSAQHDQDTIDVWRSLAEMLHLDRLTFTRIEQ
jgi:hypothetical protein